MFPSPGQQPVERPQPGGAGRDPGPEAQGEGVTSIVTTLAAKKSRISRRAAAAGRRGWPGRRRTPRSGRGPARPGSPPRGKAHREAGQGGHERLAHENGGDEAEDGAGFGEHHARVEQHADGNEEEAGEDVPQGERLGQGCRENSRPMVKSRRATPTSASRSTWCVSRTAPRPPGPSRAPATMKPAMVGSRERLRTRTTASAAAKITTRSRRRPRSCMPPLPRGRSVEPGKLAIEPVEPRSPPA